MTASGWTLARVFDEAQRSFASHNKCLAAVRHLQQEEQDCDAFTLRLAPLLDRVLVVGRREPAAERVVEFVTKLATEAADDPEERDALSSSIQRYLLGHVTAKDKSVRFRVCQLIALMLNGMGEDAEVK